MEFMVDLTITEYLGHLKAVEVVYLCCFDDTVDGRNPKQPPGMYKTL